MTTTRLELSRRRDLAISLIHHFQLKVFNKMDAIISHIPPVLFTSPVDGTVYAVAGSQWQVAPEGMTLERLHASWWIDEWRRDLPQKPHEPDIIRYAWSSKGDKRYEVRQTQGQWQCECVGFGFKRKCRHTKAAMDGQLEDTL